MTALSVLLNLNIIAFAQDETSINIALNQEAVASSYEDGHYARYAIDGINDNEEYSYWKCAAEDQSPWWQVDFGIDYKLSKIIIEARKGEYDDSEKNNFVVMVSNSADFSDYDQIAKVEQAYEEELSVSVSKTQQYRYLRIAKLDAKPLSIAEVKVMVDKSSIKQGEQAVTDTDDEDEQQSYGRYDTLKDVIGTDIEGAVTLLQNLGIVSGYTDGTFKAENTITRAEFAAVIYNIITDGTKVSYDSVSFGDVPAEHWANNCIEYLYRNSYVSGMSADSFCPNDEITIQQAAKMLVSVLRRDAYAQYQGGYPNGYMNVARELGILKNIAKGGEASATRGEIAQMVYNSLDVRVSSMEITGAEKNIKDGDTLLYTYKRIKKKTDILTAVGNVSINLDNLSGHKGRIIVDSVEYNSEIPDLERYLGYNVDLYYSDEDAETAYSVIPGRNEEKKLESDDIISMNNSNIVYETERRSTIHMPDKFYVVYNNQAVRTYDLEQLKPAYGTVRLIDNNRDGSYEVVIIEDYKSYVLAGISLNSNEIYLRNPSKTIMYDEENVTLKYGKELKSVELGNISGEMAVSVLESQGGGNNKVYTVIFSDETITGKVTRVDKGKERIYVTVNGTEYESLLSGDKFELDMTGTFYLDIFGKIVATGDSIALTEKYGYIGRVGILDDSEYLEFKIYTQYGEFITANSNDKLKIDGYKWIDADNAVSKLKEAGGGKVNQVIRYRQNGKGEIISVDTVTNGNETGGLKLSKSSYSGSYGNQLFDMNYSINDNTVMFVIPDNKSDTAQYGIKLRSELKQSSSYTFDAYDIDEYQNIACCVFSEGNVDFNENAGVMLVDKVYEEYDEYEGEERNIVCGYMDNEYVSLAEAKSGVLTGLKQGDIISVAQNLQGQVKSVLKRYYSEPDHPGSDQAVSKLKPSVGTVSSSTSWKYGTVMYKKDGKVIVDVGGESFVFNTNGEAKLRMYFYNSKNKTVGLAGYADILDAQSVGRDNASRVVVHPMWLETREVIIFK